MAPFLPACLLALFAAWAGTFYGGASFSGAVAGQGALLVVLALRPPPLGDPLGLGRAGRLLPWALLVAVAASWWASPVPRAGRVGLVLLPAFLLLPAWAAGCWGEPRARRLGLRSVAVVAMGVAVWALLDLLLLGAPRAAMPLGHHGLLAAWLVILLPLAVLPLREGGRWRWVGLAAGVTTVAAILLSRSLVGLAILVVEGAAAAAFLPGVRRRRWGWAWPLAGLTLAILSQLPRLAALLAGRDPSLAARRLYAGAGWRGFLDRPLLGWGPGAVPWTVADFLRPVPGVTPPGEVVGQLHSLPLELAYSLGGTGLALAAALLLAFLVARTAERRRAADPGLLAAGLVATAAGGALSLADAWLAVTALPVAWTVAAGAALAGGGRAVSGPGRAQGRLKGRGGGRAVGLRGLPLRVGAALAALALAPPALALWHYEAARRAAAVEVVQHHLGRAAALDPAFPLYRARRASYSGAGGAEAARRAAEDAVAVAPLWLAAGVAGVQSGTEWAPAALRRALALDPLGGLAPYYLVVWDPGAPRAPACAARALLAEPRLAAASFWRGREELLRRAAEEVLAWEGVEAGWRQALARAVAGPPGEDGEEVVLEVGRDRLEEGFFSVSLHAFRRRPWNAGWFNEPVSASNLDRFALPPAAALATSSPSAFPAAACAPAPH